MEAAHDDMSEENNNSETLIRKIQLPFLSDLCIPMSFCFFIFLLCFTFTEIYVPSHFNMVLWIIIC